MINGESSKCKKLPIWLRGNNSSVSTCGNYMIGKYTVKGDTITVTELPIGVFNESYIDSVAKIKDNLIPEIKDFNDYSNYDEEKNIDEIKIVFEF